MTNPSTPHPATLISKERLDAARPYIAMAMKGGGSVDDCIRAAIAAADPAGWQPIETAGTDAREVLACFRGQFEWVIFIARAFPLEHGGVRADRYAKPTHWRPLPPAPGDATL